MQARLYQTRTTDAVRAAERNTAGRRPRLCVVSPTGSGKTFMCGSLLADDEPQIVFVHREVLRDQLAAFLTSRGIPFGYRAAGHRRDTAARIQIAMIQTEHARVFRTKRWELHPARRVHIDEPHAQRGATTVEILNAYHAAGASLIGWTATPENVGHLFDRQIVSATVPELIAGGYLVPPLLVGPNMPDVERMEKVRRDANGEFSQKELAKVWNVKAIVGSVVEHYQRLNPAGRPAILFAPGVPHSLWFAQRLTACGIRAAHISADTIWLDGVEMESTSANRKILFALVESGDVKVLCNRFVLREGVDLPCIEHVILACAFGSRAAYVQAVGRGLRPSPGKTVCIVQDHGGNVIRHPRIDSVRAWDMNVTAAVAARDHIARMRAAAAELPDNVPNADDDRDDVEPIQCEHCQAYRIAGDVCPECGHKFTHHTRPVIETTGELHLIRGRSYLPKAERQRDDVKDWRGLLIGNRRYHPRRTFDQVYNYYSIRHKRRLPRNLPGMPMDDADWGQPVGDLSDDRLIPADGQSPNGDAMSEPSGEVQYCKLREGGWGLRGFHLEPGRTVTVVLKNGGTKAERVGEIVFEGDDGTCKATIAASAGQAAQLKKLGYTPAEIDSLSKSAASDVLDRCKENEWQRVELTGVTGEPGGGSQDDEETGF